MRCVLRALSCVFAFAAAGFGQEFAPDHLFAVDRQGNRVYEFDEAGAYVRLVGSNLSKPWGLAFGPNGHLYVACESSNCVNEFDSFGALVAQIGGSILKGPRGLAIGPRGYLYVA